MSERPAAHDTTPRIGLVTCRHHDHIDHASEGKLAQALVRYGAAVTLVAWDDLAGLLGEAKDVDGLRDVVQVLDFVVLRTPWDYWDRADEFEAWVRELGRSDRLANGGQAILANLAKTYMHQLADRGVPIVPTLLATHADWDAQIEHATGNEWDAVIAKPVVGAAAAGLARFDARDASRLREHVQRIMTPRGVLLQPFLHRVTTDGETSLVYFDGELSHAVRKIPKAGDFRSQSDFGGRYELVEATDAQRDVAERSLDAWRAIHGEMPLYARVDLVPGDDGDPLLGELELIEPELFLDMHPEAADRFADAIYNRVGP
ncbi:MAG: hypothetical protein AAFX79_06740 [Planctomycetota bacterium]